MTTTNIILPQWVPDDVKPITRADMMMYDGFSEMNHPALGSGSMLNALNERQKTSILFLAIANNNSPVITKVSPHIKAQSLKPEFKIPPVVFRTCRYETLVTLIIDCQAYQPKNLVAIAHKLGDTNPEIMRWLVDHQERFELDLTPPLPQSNNSATHLRYVKFNGEPSRDYQLICGVLEDLSKRRGIPHEALLRYTQTSEIESTYDHLRNRFNELLEEKRCEIIALAIAYNNILLLNILKEFSPKDANIPPNAFETTTCKTITFLVDSDMISTNKMLVYATKVLNVEFLKWIQTYCASHGVNLLFSLP